MHHGHAVITWMIAGFTFYNAERCAMVESICVCLFHLKSIYHNIYSHELPRFYQAVWPFLYLHLCFVSLTAGDVCAARQGVYIFHCTNYNVCCV